MGKEVILKLDIEVLNCYCYARGYDGFVKFIEKLWKQEEISNDIKAGVLTLSQVKILSEKMNIPFGFMFFKNPRDLPKGYRISKWRIFFKRLSGIIK